MPSQTLSDKLKGVYAQIDEWRNRPLERSYPYLFVDGVWHKRTWGGSVENVSVLVAIGVDDTGHREVVGVAEGMKEVYFDAPIHCQAFGCVVLGWLSSVSTGWPVARVREGRVRRVRSR